MELMRTIRSQPLRSIYFRVFRTRMRAASFWSGLTASSKSKITASAPKLPLLISMLGLLPGKNSILLRIYCASFARRIAVSTLARRTQSSAPRSATRTVAFSTSCSRRTS